MKPLTLEVKELLVLDRQHGLTFHKLAEKYEISISGARKVCLNFAKRGIVASFKSSCGRKRKTTAVDDRRIKIEARKNPLSSARNIKEDLQLNISQRTVQRRLHESGLKNYFAKKKPLLRAVIIRKRLAFARKFLSKPQSFWESVIWSDESKFELKNSKARKRVWCKSSERLNQRCIQKTVKHGGGSVMVWGCFSFSGVGNIVKIDTKMTGVGYVNIVRENLPTSARRMSLENYIFQQDNDPKHTSRLAKQFFAENNIDVLEWPPQSPDLNPIEHLWSILDDRIPFNERRNLPSFWETLQNEWERIPADILRNLVCSMPKLLAAVIQNKGGATSY